MPQFPDNCQMSFLHVIQSNTIQSIKCNQLSSRVIGKHKLSADSHQTSPPIPLMGSTEGSVQGHHRQGTCILSKQCIMPQVCCLFAHRKKMVKQHKCIGNISPYSKLRNTCNDCSAQISYDPRSFWVKLRKILDWVVGP